MEKENVFNRIERLRKNRIEFSVIEKELIENDYDREKIDFAINYTRQDEKHRYYILSLECDDYSFYKIMVINILGVVFSIFLMLASFYFIFKFIQVASTPDVIHRDNIVIVINDLWKGKLTISLFVFGLLSLIFSLTIFNGSWNSYKENKEKRIEFLELKELQK